MLSSRNRPRARAMVALDLLTFVSCDTSTSGLRTKVRSRPGACAGADTFWAAAGRLQGNPSAITPIARPLRILQVSAIRLVLLRSATHALGDRRNDRLGARDTTPSGQPAFSVAGASEGPDGAGDSPGAL